MVQTIFRIIVIGIIIAFVIGIIGTVSWGWNLDTSPYLSTLSRILAVVCYVIPISKLSPILIIFISSMLFRIVVRIVKTVWDLIPIA